MMQSPGGITYHQARRSAPPSSKAFSSIEPQRDPGRVAEAEEGERGLREDRDGDDQDRVGEDQRQRVGEDVGADDVGVARPQRPGALDEGALAQGQHLGADDPAGARPRGQPDDAISTASDGSSRRASTIISGSVGITRNQFSSASRIRSVQPPK